MCCSDLHLDCPGLHVTDLSIDPDAITVHAEPTESTAACPDCGHTSERVHSRYARRIGDLPVQGRRLVLRLATRRFYCRRPDCRRRIFCERLPGLAAAHARATGPLTGSHRDVWFALGGEAGARLAAKLAVPTSPDTLLRRVKATPPEAAPPPRYVGVDDWSLRKGREYGTILVDLERRCVIDVLPGRDGEALKAWLREHPQVEVIARDRWTAYARAADEAAPQARQVADRWHLLKNLREAVERLLTRHAAQIPAPVPARTPPTASQDAEAVGGAAPVGSPSTTAAGPETPRPVGDPVRAAKAQARRDRHQQVRDLHGRGHSLRWIARHLGMSFRTVQRYLREATCPDWDAGRPRPSELDDHRAFIADWIGRGGRNTADLFRLLRARGCRIGYSTTCRYANRMLGTTGRPGPRAGELVPPAPSPPSARKLSFAFLCPAARDGDAAREVLSRMRADVPGLGAALDLAAELAGMIRKTVTQPLSVWLDKVAACGVTDLKTFAAGIREDEAAVAAALTEPWSNGQVEGQVNRLKLIKRAGYGRAGLPLLRARVRRKV